LTKDFQNVSTFLLYVSRSFQWCTPKSSIGNGFGVKPQKIAFIQIFWKCVSSDPIFTTKQWEVAFLVLVVSYNPCKQLKPKKRFKKLKCRRDNFFLTMTKNFPKTDQKTSILSKMSNASILS